MHKHALCSTRTSSLRITPCLFSFAITILLTSLLLCYDCKSAGRCHTPVDAAPGVFLRRAAAVSDATMVACSFSPCSQMFMTGSTYGDLRLWDVRLKQLHKENNAHDLGVTCCAFAPDILSSESHCLCLVIKKLIGNWKDRQM